MSKEPKRNVYVGHRYVPKIMGEWDKTETYEGLSIVTNEGTSYTSKKRVPKGVNILNEEYWVVTGNYNAQIEEYRKDVREMEKEVGKKADQSYVDNLNEKVNTQLAQNEIIYRSKDTLNEDVGIQTIIDNLSEQGGGTVRLISDLYKIAKPLQIKPNVQVELSLNTVIEITENIDFIHLHDHSRITGGMLRVPSTIDFDKSFILLVGVHRFYDQLSGASNIMLNNRNENGQGSGIKLLAEAGTGYVYFTNFHEIFIHNVDKGIHLVALDGNTNGLNSNTFKSITVNDSAYGLYIDADQSKGRYANGNIFDITVQTTPRTIHSVYCSGRNNKVRVNDWDVKTTYSIMLTEQSAFNKITTISNSNRLIRDEGIDNILNGQHLFNSITPPTSTYVTNRHGNRELETFNGNQDDVLAYATLKHTVTTNIEPSTGITRSIFLNNSYCEFTLPTGDDLVITIELEEPIQYLGNMGFQFAAGRGVEAFDIVFTTTTDKIVTYSKEDNLSGNVMIRTPGEIRTASLKKIEIKMRKPFDRSGLVRVARIYGGSYAMDGSYYMTQYQPEVYGDLSIAEAGKGIVFKSDDGTKHRMTISNDGELRII